MCKRLFVLFLFVGMLPRAFSQAQQSPSQTWFNYARATFNAENAYNTVAFVEQRWRLAGNTGFNESIYHVEQQLKNAGFVKETKGEADGPLTYRIEKRPMRKLTWEPIDASVKIAGEAEPIIEFKTNRNMIAINSASTPDAGIEAEVLFVGKGSAADFEGKDLKGKIIFGEAAIGTLYASAVKYGAVGVMSYRIPAYTQPEVNQNSIQFSNVPAGQNIWAIQLSYKAKERLKSALAKGALKLNVLVKAKQYQSEELTIVANARGVSLPNERFVFSAHVQEPGANDNASGVGTLTEIARATAQLIRAGQLKPQRTLTFLWGDEIVSTRRYIADDSVRAKGIKWGMSLDMVGEDTRKTGGTFLIEKMPDPSAIWTRGADKHTEWGASDIKEKDLFPHYFNDFVFNRCKEQGKFADWTVNYNPFEGGSDHTPFLQAKIPGLLMWHFTDVYYHTDADRLDKVSKETMKNVGVTAMAVAYSLISADEKTSLSILNELVENAKVRLTTEFKLSKEAVGSGKTKADEQHILETWWQWYDKAISTVADVQCGGPSASVKKEIEAKRQDLKKAYASMVL